MKRSFLKELGLESEVIDKIMAENGKDIQKYKTEIEDYVEELKELKSNQVDNSKAIKDAIKTREDELNEEFKDTIEKAKKYDLIVKENEQLKAEKLNRDFSDATNILFKENEIDFTSDMARNTTISNLKEKNFEIVDGKFKSKDDVVNYLNELRENDKGAFKETTPQNTGGYGNYGRVGKQTITKEQFNSMSYTERVNLYNSNKELYTQLNSN